MSNETSGSKAEDNSQALAAFVARKADIDTVLARLIALSSDHFSRAPDRVTWGDVGTWRATSLECARSATPPSEGEHAA